MVNEQLNKLVAEAMAAYRALCARDGIDPDLELAEVTFGYQLPVHEWAARRLDADTRGAPAPDPTVAEARVHAESPHPVWALVAHPATASARRAGVARHPKCPAPVLAALAADADVSVRAAAAANVHAAPEQLETAAQDRCWEVRFEVARHTRLGPADAARLATDPNTMVRSAVAANKAAGPAALARLCTDGDPTVRERAFANPATPPDVVAREVGGVARG